MADRRDGSREAQRSAEIESLIEEELDAQRRAGYATLREVAPRPVGGSRGILSRWRGKKLEAHPAGFSSSVRQGPSGKEYAIDREVEWDDRYGGTLRVCIYVYDEETKASPAFRCELIAPE